MPATTGPSHGRQSLSQLLAVWSNARNGANALQWAIPLAICGRKGRAGRLTGFQGVYGANSTLAQRALRKPQWQTSVQSLPSLWERQPFLSASQ